MGRRPAKEDGDGEKDNGLIAQEEKQGSLKVNKTDSVEEDRENREIDKDMIYMAITNPDSTVVYYKLTRGIKKPADIPDE